MKRMFDTICILILVHTCFSYVYAQNVKISEIQISPDGGVKLAWKTNIPSPPARVYYGLIYNQPYYYPYTFFKESVIESKEDTLRLKEHRVKFDISEFGKSGWDVADSYSLGRAIVGFRIEQFDPRYITSRFFDLCFGVRIFKTGGKYRYERAPAFTEGPIVDIPAVDTVVISWTTDLDTSGFIELETDETKDIIQFTGGYEDPNRGYVFEISLTKLKPDTVYKYTIFFKNKDDFISYYQEGFQFRTPPCSEREFKFAFISDTRGGFGGGDRDINGVNACVFRELLNDMSSHQVEFILFGGDLVRGYTDDPSYLSNQLKTWKQTTFPFGASIPIFEGVGNHENIYVSSHIPGSDKHVESPYSGENCAESVFSRHFINPQGSCFPGVKSPAPESKEAPPYGETVYSFNYANSHFIAINNDYWYTKERGGYVLENQMRWLEDDLKAARANKVRHIFLFTHEPTFPNGGHVKDSMWHKGDPSRVRFRDSFWGLMVKYGVLIVMASHEHNYSRTLIDENTQVYNTPVNGKLTNPLFSKPVWQIISGGGGAPVYSIEKNVPWANSVKVFSCYHHYCLFHVKPEKVVLDAIGIYGEKLDHVEIEASMESE